MSTDDRFDIDDPRLTAYVLGALDADERARVEALLERDSDARAFVEGLRAAADAASESFANTAQDKLLPAQRRTVLAGPRRSLAERVLFGWAPLVAASLALVATYQYLSGGVRFLSRDVSTAAVPRDGMPPQRRANGFTSWMKALGYSSGPEDSGSVDPVNAVLIEQLGYQGKEWRPPVESGNTNGRVALRFSTRRYDEGTPLPSGESYEGKPSNSFTSVADDSRSTFSIDVDTASYANTRRFLLQQGTLPPPDAVRIEEFINYFTYDTPAPAGGEPFSVTTEVADCPWQPDHRLVRIALRARDIDADQRPPANLVFLIDVSGSMNQPNKLPLLVRSMKMLVDQLDHRDRIAIVVYAGSSGVVLPSTPGNQRGFILTALDRLSAGGSTHGAAGIELAYRVAAEQRIDGGINRVLLCTDGDFNVGVSNREALTRLIEQKRESGTFLSVFGFGDGNLRDDIMERLADHGNGSYAYIDSLMEARKVLVEQVGGTLAVIAKDVKIQVEFNPARVGAWRLIGYENRVLAHQDFDDDQKDAGEIGAGLSVTALYQVAPPGVVVGSLESESRYQPRPVQTQPVGGEHPDELLFVRLRYKDPEGDESRLIEAPVLPRDTAFRAASRDLRFAASVAGFAMLLKRSPYIAGWNYDQARAAAADALVDDPGGYRAELVRLIDQARRLSR